MESDVRCRTREPALSGAAPNSHPAPPRIEKLVYSLHRHEPACAHNGERRPAGEDGIAVGKLDPLVGELVAVEDVQGLVGADKVGNPGDAVDLKDTIRVLLPLVISAARESAEELAGVLVAQLPAPDNLEEATQCGTRQPPALGL